MSPTSRIGSRRDVLRAAAVAGVVAVAGCVRNSQDGNVLENDSIENTEDGIVETVGPGLDEPWGITTVPDAPQLLVTERVGGLVLVDTETDTGEVITGLPDVHVAGQGGLLDVAVHPDFPDERWLYLTYSATDNAGESATHLARGRLDRAEFRLIDLEVLAVAEPFVGSTGHYGSRVIFGPDDNVYVTSGDRQDKEFGPDHPSQDLSTEHGVTMRLNPDGSIPADNPFVDDPDAADTIYSYGHRNAQGMTVHPETGEIWQSEHGEQDGDEINVIERGGNYGWPVTHYGCTYAGGDSIGDLPHERKDVVDPVFYWECNSGGFPPAGMTFYEGNAFPEWQGDLFVGNLAGQYLGRFSVDGRTVEEAEPLLSGRGWRVRDVEADPETGYLYVAIDDTDSPLVRVRPE